MTVVGFERTLAFMMFGFIFFIGFASIFRVLTIIPLYFIDKELNRALLDECRYFEYVGVIAIFIGICTGIVLLFPWHIGYVILIVLTLLIQQPVTNYWMPGDKCKTFVKITNLIASTGTFFIMRYLEDNFGPKAISEKDSDPAAMEQLAKDLKSGKYSVRLSKSGDDIEVIKNF